MAGTTGLGPAASAVTDNLEDTRGLPTQRKSHKTYQTVGWVVVGEIVLGPL